MTREQFVESYIKKISDAINEYNESECDENTVFDCIQEIRGVFSRDIPEMDDAIWMRTGTAKRDANIVLGLLEKQLINSSTETKSETTKAQQYLRDHKELELDYEGIRKNIDDYTSEGNVINYLAQLNNALSKNDLYSIQFCLAGFRNRGQEIKPVILYGLHKN